MGSLALPFGAADSEHIFADEDMSHAHVQPFLAGVVAVYSARCPESTGSNEDAAALVALDDSRGVIAVADGAGGQPSGAKASSLALGEIAGAVGEISGTLTPLRDAILDGFERANRAVMALGNGAATTLIVAEIDGESVRTYHTGDSMVLVTGQRGKVKLQTVSHSPVGYAIESGLLDEREAMHHENRHIVSNMIGDSGMRIEIGSSLVLARRDTLVLASDGLFDNLHNPEIIDGLRTGALDRATLEVATSAHRRMSAPTVGVPSKPDDLTFCVYRRSS